MGMDERYFTSILPYDQTPSLQFCFLNFGLAAFEVSTLYQFIYMNLAFVIGYLYGSTIGISVQIYSIRKYIWHKVV